MPKPRLAAVLLLSAASACSATAVRTDACEPWSPPLRFSAAAIAAMDAEDLRRLDAYYGTGERLCGWAP